MQIEGLVLGKYRIEKLINNGSFASVFRAKEELTNRIVAIKALSKSVYPPGRTHYLLTELSAMAMSWGHPNIVSIHTVEPGADEYIAYIVMEYVDGPSLRQLIGVKPLSPHWAINIALDICRGLIAAHEHNIIHRDIKPQNILLTSGHTAKISDFGVARILEETSEYAGTITGTRKYMAPEQYEGNYDYRADVYATGLILYEMLTGKFPFRGESHDEIQMKKRSAEIELIDELPNDLRELLLKALHRDMKSRYQTAAGMYNDLDGIRKKWYADEARKAINIYYLNPNFSRTTLSKCREDLRLSAEAAEKIELELLHEKRNQEDKRKQLDLAARVNAHYEQALKNLDSAAPQRALLEMQQAHRLYLTDVETAKQADCIFRQLSDLMVTPKLITTANDLINVINELPANEILALKEWFHEQFPPTESSIPPTAPYTTVRETLSGSGQPVLVVQEPSPESILRRLHGDARTSHEITAAQICQAAERYAYQGNQRKARSEYKKIGEFYRKHAEEFAESEDWRFVADYYARARFAYMAANRHRSARHSAREAGMHYTRPAATLEKQKNWAEAGRLYTLSAENYVYAGFLEAADESRLRATICYFNVAENAYATGNLKETYDYCKKTLMVANEMKLASNAATGARKLIKEIEALFTASCQRQSSRRSLR